MKKFLTVLLTFTLYFNLITQANAANVGGWTLGGGVAQGASTVYDATKNVVINGKKFIKESSVKITPTATSVAKVLARGAAGYALSVAVEQLLGSVDWILDPANNQIKYWDLVQVFQSQASYGGIKIAQSQTEACQISIDYVKSNTAGNYSRVINGGITLTGNQLQCRILAYRASAPNSPLEFLHYWSLTEVKEDQPKTLPLETVAAQVISNAESNTDKRAAAQAATTAAAADIVAEAEKDDAKARPIASQAEANATTKPADAAEAEKANEAQGEAKPNEANPETTDLSITFPIFCNWAPTVCEAAQTVISFPQTLTNWWETGKTKAEEWANSISEAWTSVKDWAKSENQDDTELDIPEQEQPDIDTDIAFGGSCPSDREAEVNMGVGIIKLPISYEPICTTVSTAKPVLIFVGFFIAALIIGGVKTE